MITISCSYHHHLQNKTQRRRLHDKYGDDVVDIRGPMPALLLSDMWCRWTVLLTFVFPSLCVHLLNDVCGKYSFTTSASRVYILIKRFWNNLYQFVEPFSGKPAIDPTEAMKKQNYTIRKMFQVHFKKLTKMENTRLVFSRRGTTSMQQWACSGCRTHSGNAQCWRNQRIERWLSSLEFAFPQYVLIWMCFFSQYVLLWF